MSPDWWRDCRDGIEKCSSPTGDGNDIINSQSKEVKTIEKCSSPTGDGNEDVADATKDAAKIEKCSCPTGDGNGIKAIATAIGPGLRNVVPRQGTEMIKMILCHF